MLPEGIPKIAWPTTQDGSRKGRWRRVDYSSPAQLDPCASTEAFEHSSPLEATQPVDN
jgi:hypothetical protein